jgi:hypothetical protein
MRDRPHSEAMSDQLRAVQTPNMRLNYLRTCYAKAAQQSWLFCYNS